MKTILPSIFKNAIAVTLFFVTALLSTKISAQTNPELVFQNPSRISGSNGADGAIYQFSAINSTHNALVKIVGRSSASVRMNDIDLSSSGYNNAFQPRVEYTGNSGGASWWMEFEISFVNSTTQALQVIPGFKATIIDNDGDNSTLNESVSFYSLNSYTLENNTAVTVSNITENIAGNPVIVGKKFDGSSTLYSSGVDTSETTIMTTVTYTSANMIRLRVGGSKSSPSSLTNRIYSIWFKSFDYTTPVTLPVKLTAFNAVLNNNSNKVDLTWSTASEINVSHFVVEKSTDGINYSDAGVVFAYGTATGKADYKLSDNIANDQAKIIYYRLRSVDIDGKGQLSATRIIRRNSQEENKITILTYPNPVSNELRITVPANWQNKKAVYEVFNSNGQIAKRAETSNSSQTETINVTNLAPGFYIVRVSCEGQIAQQKIVKH